MTPSAIPIGLATDDLPSESWAGCTADELAGLWEVPSVYLYNSVGSTNDIARQLAVGGAPNGSLVIADQQTRGRGRAGRVWSSPPALGLYLSQLIRPVDGRFSTLPLRLGVQLARRLDRWSADAVAVKWPNDLLIGGKKLAGILCEAAWSGPRIDHIVVGIGINVLHRSDDYPPEVRDTAVSLAECSAEPVSRFEVASAVVEALRALDGDDDDWLAEIGHRNALAQCAVEVFDPDTGRLTGQGSVTGFDPDGGLVVSDGGETTVVRSGTVRIVQRP